MKAAYYTEYGAARAVLQVGDHSRSAAGPRRGARTRALLRHQPVGAIVAPAPATGPATG